MNHFTKKVVCLMLVCISTTVFAQSIIEDKINCRAKCGSAGDEMANTKLLYGFRHQYEQVVKSRTSKTTFPLRFLFVSDHVKTMAEYKNECTSAIVKLNKGFDKTNISFSLEKIDTMHSIIKIEDLYNDNYGLYKAFSSANDLANTISVYVFDYETNLCITSPTSISCARTSGFSYILSQTTANVVLSKFDLSDDKVLAHELGHFFGLYHTFEDEMFGKDNFVEDCNIAGDCICDTPPDPGALYEVYINYSDCKMLGYYHDNGHIYDPLIDNYMSYYKPCYMRPYTFTAGQIEVLNLSAVSDLRRQYGR